jgi:hypothetical protein
MPNLAKMLVAANEARDRFDEIIWGMEVLDSGEARVSATLCLTISEQFAAALHLIENGFSTHAPIIVRSMLEGLASLLNLVDDPNYVDQLKFEDARSNVVLFKEYAAVPDMKENKEAIATLNAWQKEAQQVLDELEARGFKPQSTRIGDKLRKAKMEHDYVAYRVFCSFAHNQLTTLLSRHAGNFELHYQEEAPAETTASLLTVALDIFCQAVRTLPKSTNVSEDRIAKSLEATAQAWSTTSQN